MGFKLQGFGGTLCWYRFPSKNLVKSCFQSILPDAENRCDLPLVTRSVFRVLRYARDRKTAAYPARLTDLGGF